MAGVGTLAVERAVAAMTIGTVKAFDARKRADWVDAQDEYDEQFQIPVAGNVGPRAVWAEKDVAFSVNFYDAPERDTPFDTPLFTYGFEFEPRNAPDGSGARSRPVMASAFVVAWKRNGPSITGATLSIGLVNPGGRAPVYFSGLLHANFQGYGAPSAAELFDAEES